MSIRSTARLPVSSHRGSQRSSAVAFATELREKLVAALRECDGSVTRAAARVGKHRQQFQRQMRRLGIDRAELERDT